MHAGTNRKAPKPAIRWVDTPNQSSRNGATITQVVLHYTTSRSLEGTVSWFATGSSAAGQPVSAHYIVGQDGQIVQMVNDAAKAWHAGGANANSIGIEFSAAKGDKLTPKQNVAGKALVKYLAEEYHLDIAAFSGHRFLSTTTTGTDCPGSLWTSLVELRRWVQSAIVSDATVPPEPTPPTTALKYKACPVPLPWIANLERTDTGFAVYQLQCALIGLRYLAKPSETESVGIEFNDNVEFAVKDLQGDAGIPMDGIVGPLTRAAIEKSLIAARSPKPSPTQPTDSKTATLTAGRGKYETGRWVGLLHLVLTIGDETFNVCSGQVRAQGLRRPTDPRSYPGNAEPIPQGRYLIENISWAGKSDNYAVSHGEGLGPVWVALSATFSDDRGAFGFHGDYGAIGTMGCVGIKVEELPRFVAALREFDPSHLEVDWKL